MKNIFKALVAVCAISLASGAGAGVIVGDKEWRQVTETLEFSWDDFDSVCDTSDGSCSGSLTNGTVGTVSFDSWTWASQGDVAGLFQGLNGWDGPSVTNFSYRPNSSTTTWAADFFDGLGFLPTNSQFGGGINSTKGLVRAPRDSSTNVFAAAIEDSDGSFGVKDGATTGLSDIPEVPLFGGGGWFYRAATSTPSVPAPPTLALLLVPALLMVAMRRKRLSH